MRVLVACEFSGRVRSAFRGLGHDAYSCDLLPAEDGSPHHIEDDVRRHLDAGWDLLIGHPPCTYLCLSAVWALTRTPPNPRPGRLYGPERWQAMEEAAALFRALLEAPVPCVAVENPMMHGHALARIGGVRPRQTVQPYQFGHDASKATCLWLRGLPLLAQTSYIPPRYIDGRPRWGNQTDSGQNKLTPSERRWKDRSRTYEGIARAFAEQWSDAAEFQLVG